MSKFSEARPIWVTGAAGFIGSRVAAALAAKGERVIGFGRRAAYAPALDAFVSGGLNTEALQLAIAEHGQPAQVYHFAGGPTVGASLADPLGDFESNVTSTAFLLDALRRSAPDASIVLASSAAIYGDSHKHSIPADALPRPLSPYGRHKEMAEALGISYAENYGMRIAILRLFSIYGSGLRKQLLYDLCLRLERGEDPLVLFGTGHEQRDWCHVEDVAALCIDLGPAAPGEALIFNVGTGKGTDSATVAKMVAGYWGGRDIQFNGICRPGDPFSLVASPGSLPPGHTAKWTLEAGVLDYIRWFRSGAG